MAALRDTLPGGLSEEEHDYARRVSLVVLQAVRQAGPLC
jgi:hypothetical protein